MEFGLPLTRNGQFGIVELFLSLMSSPENNNKSHRSIYDRPKLSDARKLYDQLRDLVDNLSPKLTTLYNYNEKEFLSSYRVHTLHIQSEMKSLKDRVRIAEDALNDDKVVATLEKDANWFRDETERLTRQFEHMQNDHQALSERIDALYEQRQFLSDQLKAVLKRTKVTEAELAVHKHNITDGSESLEPSECQDANISNSRRVSVRKPRSLFLPGICEFVTDSSKFKEKLFTVDDRIGSKATSADSPYRRYSYSQYS